jgi:hypothetical protein
MELWPEWPAGYWVELRTRGLVSMPEDPYGATALILPRPTNYTRSRVADGDGVNNLKRAGVV